MIPILDFYNLMAYDYAGSWDPNAAHQANLHSSKSNPASTPFSTDAAIDYYLSQGVPSEKIILGMPMYGRAFDNTYGVGTPYNGVGEGNWENGVWDYNALPHSGAQEYLDEQVGASYSYDPAKRRFISYDTVPMAQIKARYIQKRNLGGGMWWEASGDRDRKNGEAGNGSLIGTYVDTIQAVSALDHSPNVINFPESSYDNVRTGFTN